MKATEDKLREATKRDAASREAVVLEAKQQPSMNSSNPRSTRLHKITTPDITMGTTKV